MHGGACVGRPQAAGWTGSEASPDPPAAAAPATPSVFLVDRGQTSQWTEVAKPSSARPAVEKGH